jgi:hypothetical protein
VCVCVFVCIVCVCVCVCGRSHLLFVNTLSVHCVCACFVDGICPTRSHEYVVSRFRFFAQLLKQTLQQSVAEHMHALRVHKTVEERDILRHVCELSARSFVDVMKSTRPGRTEHQL